MAMITQPLERQERAVFNLLLSGKYGVVDITKELHICDPRSIIRRLRNKGYSIQDEWRQSNDGKRYKVYFVEHFSAVDINPKWIEFSRLMPSERVRDEFVFAIVNYGVNQMLPERPSRHWRDYFYNVIVPEMPKARKGEKEVRVWTN